MNNELKSLQNEDTWHAYRKRLTAYAGKRLREVLSVSESNELVLDGMAAADFACQAMIDVVDGIKPWDETDCPKLLTFLIRVVRDEIRNAIRRHDTTHTKSTVDEEDFGVDHNALSPVNESEAKLFVQGFIQYLEAEGEEDLTLIVYCFAEGQERAEVAKSLGLSPEDVTNMRKRLSRRMMAYQANIQQIYSA